MADKQIGSLPVANHLDDESLLVVEQQGAARSIKGRLIRQFATSVVQESVSAAQTAAQSAQKAAEDSEAARDEAQELRDSIEIDRQALAAAVANAEQSAQEAAISEGNAADSATLAESWAQGGTGTRPGEDTDNAEYWADRAQAYAQQASVPPVQGVYNVILTDSVTGDRYALVVNNGVLMLLGVADTLEATTLSLVDGATGVAYSLVVESGVLKLEEVS